MSVAFFSDEKTPIQRKLPLAEVYVENLVIVDNYYELDRCVEWINENNFSKIALQFSDYLLKDAAAVGVKIEDRTKKKIYILGDSNFGCCCVDEIAAEHVSADAIIHFGHACLSPTQRLPVLYIFGLNPIDVESVNYEFRKIFKDKSSLVIIYYEAFYSHAIGQIAKCLKDYENLVIPELEIPHQECKTKVNDNEVKLTKYQRNFIIPKSKDVEDYSVFYIGTQSRSLTNIMLSFNQCKFYKYDPLNKIAEPETLDVNKYLKRRYYYIEKTKDAKIIGILVGTLGVSDYLTAIKQLRDMIKQAGKKSYTLVVGKVNIAKLANFAEIEVFVSVACMETSVVDCYGFYQPIITPYELEIALTQAREWTGDYITDFSELLPGAAKHIPLEDAKFLEEADMSLITGRLRSIDYDRLKFNPFVDESDNDSLALVHNDQTVSTIHSHAAGDYLSQRSWKGLEQQLGETPASEIVEGQSGIASKYENEGNEN